MPLDVGGLQRKVRTITIEFDDESFTVDYYPAKLTGKLNATIVHAAEEPELTGIDEAVGVLVKGWDLTDGGKPLKVSKETVAEMPLMLKLRICNGIVTDVTDPNRVRVLPGGSPPEAKPA
jgi:hypothetical protein